MTEYLSSKQCIAVFHWLRNLQLRLSSRIFCSTWVRSGKYNSETRTNSTTMTEFLISEENGGFHMSTG